MASTMKEVDYQCTDQNCGHTQTVRYFPHETVNPVVNCVSCRAGFGIDQREQWATKMGMVPQKSRMVA